MSELSPSRNTIVGKCTVETWKRPWASRLRGNKERYYVFRWKAPVSDAQGRKIFPRSLRCEWWYGSDGTFYSWPSWYYSVPLGEHNWTKKTISDDMEIAPGDVQSVVEGLRWTEGTRQSWATKMINGLQEKMSSSSSNSIKQAWKKHWPREAEQLVALCNVSILYRPLDSSRKERPEETSRGASSSSSNSYPSISSISGSSEAFSRYIASLAPFSHWAILFHWPEEVADDDGLPCFPRTLRYEGFKVTLDGEDLLIPAVFNDEPEGEDWVKRRIGDISISPKSVHHKAKELWLNNGNYNVLKMNCQNWAKELYKEVSGNDIEDILDISSIIPKGL